VELVILDQIDGMVCCNPCSLASGGEFDKPVL